MPVDPSDVHTVVLRVGLSTLCGTLNCCTHWGGHWMTAENLGSLFPCNPLHSPLCRALLSITWDWKHQLFIFIECLPTLSWLFEFKKPMKMKQCGIFFPHCPTYIHGWLWKGWLVAQTTALQVRAPLASWELSQLFLCLGFRNRN